MYVCKTVNPSKVNSNLELLFQSDYSFSASIPKIKVDRLIVIVMNRYSDIQFAFCSSRRQERVKETESTSETFSGRRRAGWNHGKFTTTISAVKDKFGIQTSLLHCFIHTPVYGFHVNWYSFWDNSICTALLVKSVSFPYLFSFLLFRLFIGYKLVMDVLEKNFCEQITF